MNKPTIDKIAAFACRKALKKYSDVLVEKKALAQDIFSVRKNIVRIPNDVMITIIRDILNCFDFINSRSYHQIIEA